VQHQSLGVNEGSVYPDLMFMVLAKEDGGGGGVQTKGKKLVFAHGKDNENRYN